MYLKLSSNVGNTIIADYRQEKYGDQKNLFGFSGYSIMFIFTFRLDTNIPTFFICIPPRYKQTQTISLLSTQIQKYQTDAKCIILLV